MFYDVMFLVPLINSILATSSIFLIFATTVLLFNLYTKDKSKISTVITPFIWPLIFLTSIGGVFLSLIYSEIFLFVPCSLCWLQRIALYPQALLAIIAWLKNDTTHFPIYGISLSIFGLIVAVYQYIYQMLPKETREGFIPCLADGSADCADKVIDLFGFVTFPFISAVSFTFLITLYIYLKKKGI